MAKGNKSGFGAGSKAMGGPGKKPATPKANPFGGGSPTMPGGSPMGYKKGGAVKKKGKK